VILLPLYSSMKRGEQNYVIDQLRTAQGLTKAS
jgi:hypothetical protein